MVGRLNEDKPEIDYIDHLNEKLAGHTLVKSRTIGASNKGSATADIKLLSGSVEIYWNGKKLTVESDNPAELKTQIKASWRKWRWVKLRDCDNK